MFRSWVPFEFAFMCENREGDPSRQARPAAEGRLTCSSAAAVWRCLQSPPRGGLWLPHLCALWGPLRRLGSRVRESPPGAGAGAGAGPGPLKQGCCLAGPRSVAGELQWPGAEAGALRPRARSGASWSWLAAVLCPLFLPVGRVMDGTDTALLCVFQWDDRVC